MLFDLLPSLLLGFGLGALHAFDADHVMAVSALNNEQPSVFNVLKRSAHWALGHAGVLIVAGALLFGLGYALPDLLVRAAEFLVGVVLIALGVATLLQLRKQRLSLSTHSHNGVRHTHWHDASLHEKRGDHRPVFVGVLHGLAGSAPALALVPVASMQSVSTAMIYLILFSIGVMLAMMTFGFGLAKLQKVLSQQASNLFVHCRSTLAVASILFGGYWLAQAV